MEKYINIKKKLIMFVVCALFIPVLLMNIVMSAVYIQQMNEKTRNNYQYISTISYNNAYDTFAMYEKLLNKIAFDPDVIENLARLNNTTDYQTSLQCSKSIDDQISNIALENAEEEIYRITLYPVNPDATPIGTYVASVRNVETQQWFSNLQGRGEYVYVRSVLGENVMGICRYIYNGDFVNSKDSIAIINILFMVK